MRLHSLFPAGNRFIPYRHRGSMAACYFFFTLPHISLSDKAVLTLAQELEML